MHFLLRLAIAFMLPGLVWAKASCPAPEGYTPIAERSGKHLLYEMRPCAGKPSYLFGTFHSDSRKLNPIFAHATRYMQKTEALWLEVVVTPEAQQAIQKQLINSANAPNMSDVIGADMFAKVVEKLSPILKLPPEVMQGMQIWAVAVMSQYPKHSADGVVLDARLQQFAAARGMPVKSLETPAEQFAVFESMTQTMQIAFLQNVLDEIETLDDTLTLLEQHYLAKDLPAIYTLSREIFAEQRKTAPALADHLEHYLIDARNQRMAERIALQLARPQFIAVGALHLPGETGMLALLEQAGFFIYPIP